MRAERTVRVGAVFCGRDDDAEGPFAPGWSSCMTAAVCVDVGGGVCVCVSMQRPRGEG